MHICTYIFVLYTYTYAYLYIRINIFALRTPCTHRYLYMHICMYIFVLYTYICVFIYTYKYICTTNPMYSQVFVDAYMYVHICLIYIYIYVFVLYTYTCIYLYIHINIYEPRTPSLSAIYHAQKKKKWHARAHTTQQSPVNDTHLLMTQDTHYEPHVHTDIYKMYVWVYILCSMYVWVYIYTHMCMYIFVLYTYTHIYLCIYICIYICIRTANPLTISRIPRAKENQP